MSKRRMKILSFIALGVFLFLIAKGNLWGILFLNIFILGGISLAIYFPFWFAKNIFKAVKRLSSMNTYQKYWMLRYFF